MPARRSRLLLLATVSVAALAAGCGQGSSAPASGPGDAARAIPAGSLAYLQVDLDHDSAAWQRFTAVGRGFPGWQQLIGTLRGRLDGGRETFTRHVEPWLGGEAAVAVTSIDAGRGKPNLLVYLASTDDGKAIDAIRSRPDPGRPAGSLDGYREFRSGGDYVAAGDGAVLMA